MITCIVVQKPRTQRHVSRLPATGVEQTKARPRPSRRARQAAIDYRLSCLSAETQESAESASRPSCYRRGCESINRPIPTQFRLSAHNHNQPCLTHDQYNDIRPVYQWLQPLGARSGSCRARLRSPFCSNNSKRRASSLLLMQQRICLPKSDSGVAHGQGRSTIVNGEADMQLHQQQTPRRGVRRATRARTRLAKGMMSNSPLKAHTPTQPFLHALCEGDGPPDARTTVAAIATPSPGAWCRGQRKPVPAHLVDVARTAAGCMLRGQCIPAQATP